MSTDPRLVGCTGTSDSLVVPLPSWPYWLFPPSQTAAPPVAAMLRPTPAATVTAPLRESGSGSSYRPDLPMSRAL